MVIEPRLRQPELSTRTGERWCPKRPRSEEHTSELQSLTNLVCRLLLEKKNERDPVTSRDRPLSYNQARSALNDESGIPHSTRRTELVASQDKLARPIAGIANHSPRRPH